MFVKDGEGKFYKPSLTAPTVEAQKAQVFLRVGDSIEVYLEGMGQRVLQVRYYGDGPVVYLSAVRSCNVHKSGGSHYTLIDTVAMALRSLAEDLLAEDALLDSESNIPGEFLEVRNDLLTLKKLADKYNPGIRFPTTAEILEGLTEELP